MPWNGVGEWGVAAKGDRTSLLNVLEFDSSDDCTGFWICQKPEINTLSRVCYMVWKLYLNLKKKKNLLSMVYADHTRKKYIRYMLLNLGYIK